ncbi:MAG: hypothetical protein Q9214_003158, partial [Letrouitia sp. 1 TL-2023]
TPSAEVLAPRKFTPRMQAYCVKALAISMSSCFGTTINVLEGGDVMEPKLDHPPIIAESTCARARMKNPTTNEGSMFAGPDVDLPWWSGQSPRLKMGIQWDIMRTFD